MNRRYAKLLAAPLGVVLLAGCGSEEDMQARLAEATAQLDLIPSGRGTVPPAQLSGDPYAEVRRILEPVLESTIDAEKAAAHLIIGETELAMASGKYREATARQRDFLDRIMNIESMLNVWQIAETRRSLAASFDASEERQKLRSEIGELDASITQGRETLTSLENELDRINKEITDLLASAQEERSEAARLEIQADSADPSNALPLITEAQRHSRTADGLIMRAEKLRGKLEQLAPQIDRQQLQIQGQENAREVRVEDLEALTESEEFHRAQASEAARETESTRNELADLLFGGDGLAAFLDGGLREAMDDAEAAFQRAERSARSATSLRKQSNLLIGRIKHAQAQGAFNQARELERFRLSLERLASIDEIADPEPRIGDLLADIREREIAQFQKARTIYGEAQSAFESAQLRGEAADLSETLLQQFSENQQAIDDHLADLGVSGEG